MSAIQILVAQLVAAGLLAVVAGLFWRRRAHLCWSFVVYLLTVVGTDALTTWRPGDFHNVAFYLAKETICNVLALLIGIELAWHAFHAFPGAAARARLVVGASLAVTTAAVMGIPMQLSDMAYVTMYQPRLQLGAAWLVTATTALVVFYHLPMHALRRAISIGMVVYLAVSNILLARLARAGWAGGEVLGLVDGITYLGISIAWAYAAWRPAEAIAPATAARFNALGVEVA